MLTAKEGEPAVAASDAANVDDDPDFSPELVCDLPILGSAEDRLGFGAYAEALAELIDSPRVATPLTLSIDAPWGAGKTSLARLIERKACEWPKVRGDPPHIVCWFNAWMHSDAPNLGPALAAAVGKTVARDRPTWRRLVSPMPAAMLSPSERRRRRVLVLAFAALAAVIAVFAPRALTSSHVSDQTGGLLGVGVLAGVSIAASLWTSALGVAQATATFIDNPQSQAEAGSMADVSAQFAKLVHSATRGRRRLVIFVDDLDRCAPERALQMCETASLLLSVPDVVTVLIGDLAALRGFARQRFSSTDTVGQVAGEDYGRNYFDKIVQLDFSLPPPDQPALASMLAHRSALPPTERGHPSEKPASPRMSNRLRPRAWLARAFAFASARPRRFAAFVGITLALWLVVAAIVGVVDPRSDQSTSGWGNDLIGAWGTVTFLLWIPVGVGTLHQWLRKRRTRRSTAEIDATIRDKARSRSESNVETISQVVTSASARLVAQRLRRANVEQLVSEGSGELASYYPGLPRSVKRVANRHYLLASVAVSRQMIGGTPPLTAAHLSKWALMMERWPDLAEEIIERPLLAGELERRARSDEDACGTHSLSDLLPEQVPQRDELIRLLRDPTSIAAIADRLVFALPAHS
jgi:ABC-type multidrug transport system fused ATPase/permease subunit